MSSRGLVLGAALLAAAAALLGPVSATESPSTLLWPVPQAYQCTDGNAPVSAVFSITTAASNTVLTAAIARYQSLYQNLVGTDAPGLHATPVLTTMTIAVTDASGDLNPSTSFKCVWAVGCPWGWSVFFLAPTATRGCCCFPTWQRVPRCCVLP